MKKFVSSAARGAAVLALVLGGALPPVSAQGTSTARTLTQLEEQAAEAIGAGRWEAALSTMESMRALGVRLPESFQYYYAQALAQQGRYVDARSALSSYLSGAGTSARFAAPARSLLEQIEKPASEQQARLDAERRETDLAQEQAEGVRRSARLIRSTVSRLGGEVASVAFTLEGDRVLAAVANRVSLIDIDKREVIGRLNAPSPVVELAPHPLGHGWAVAHAQGAGVWRSTSAPPVPGLSDARPAGAVAVHPEGLAIAVGLQNGTVRRADTRTRLWSDWTHLGKAPVRHLAYSPDGRWLAAATAGRPVTVHVGPIDSGAQASKLTLDSGALDDLAFTPDAARLIAADASGRRLLALAAGAGNSNWSPFVEGVQITPGTLAMDPRGRMLVFAHGPLIELRDLAQGALIGRLYLPAGTKVTATAFDFDGSQLATGLADGTVHVWNVSGY